MISALRHYFDALGAWVTVVVGLVFIFCVLVFRRGVLGEVSHFLLPRLAARHSTKEEKNA